MRCLTTSIIIFLCGVLCLPQAYALQKVNVLLDWFVNPNHAPLVIAMQKNYFQEQGLTVNLIAPADPNDATKLLAAKRADIAISYQPQLLILVDKKLPLMRFATLIAGPLDCMLALKKSGIKQISDLKGKRIGYPGDAADSALLNTILRQAGLTIKDIQLINVHYNLSQALLSKNIDVAMGMMRNFELVQLKLLNEEAIAFYPEKYGVPVYDELVFLLHSDREHDPLFKKFTLALQKGIAYVKQYPDESWQLFIKAYPAANNELNHQAWYATLNYFPDDPLAFNKKQYQTFMQFMYEQKFISQLLPIGKYVAKNFN